MVNPHIAVTDLSFTYEGRARPVLSRLSFGLEEGRSLLVLGPSGSGKSTLTLCLNGLIPHAVEGDYQGKVVVAGIVAADTPAYVLSTEVGLVFQDPESQFCTLSVEEEVAFGLENLCVPAEAMGPRIREALALVGLEGFEGRRLHRLSGGEKQRVALASVLAMQPRVVVLDEPSANLDPQGTVDLFRVLRRLHEARRHTLVLIEHRLDDVMEWIDEVLVLGPGGGLLTQGGPRDVFYDDGRLLRSAGVWLPQVVEVVAGLRDAGWDVPGRPLTPADLVDALSWTEGWGAGITQVLAPYEFGNEGPGVGLGSNSGPFFSVRDLSYAYPGGDGTEVLQGITFDIRSGEWVAVVGANGAGKSTLAGMLSGVREAPRGTVFVAGEDVRTVRPARLAGLVGHVFQNPEHQFVSERVGSEILAGRPRRRGENPERVEAESLELLARFGLEEYAESNPFTLSQGQKRRLSVAAMMARGQKALILDEPTFGQDRTQSSRLQDMLLTLNREGHTIVTVTHDMELVAACGRRVIVLADGRVVFDGSPARLFRRRGELEGWGLVAPLVPRLCAALREAGVSAPGGAAVKSGLTSACQPESARGLAPAHGVEPTRGPLTVSEFVRASGRPRREAVGARVARGPEALVRRRP